MIRQNVFKKTAPKFAPELLPEGFGQVALNCKTDRGTLRPYRANTAIWTPTKAGTKLTIYKFGDFWFHWITDVDVVKGPVAGDVQQRTYFTGDGAPKVTDTSIAVSGGGTNYPTNSYTLGIPAPASAPNVAAQGTADGTVPAEDRVYVVTNVSGWGEEGATSPASALVTVGGGQTVALSNIPGPPSGDYNITHQRIYRAVTGSDGTASFFYVGQILSSATTFTDNVEVVGELLRTASWFPPPTDLKGLKAHPNGFLVGFTGFEVCFSEAYVPSAWPEEYRLSSEFAVVGLGVFATSILVCTTGHPYLISGSSPDGMVMERVDISQACVSKRGIVDMGAAVAYPSPDGLIMVGLGGAKNATENVLTRDDWQALTPSSIVGAYHDGKYFGFYNNGTPGGFIFDPATGDLGFVDVAATAAYSHLESDTLYLVVAGDIVSFDTGANKTQKWKSKRHVVPSVNPPSAKITARGYHGEANTLTFKLYADQALKHTQNVTSGRPFRLPGGYLAETLEFEVESNQEITMIQIGPPGAMI